jgi:aspartate aminotransferase-like enzyme
MSSMNVASPSASARVVVPQDYRLRLPGPATVPERVRTALARPVVSHRGPEFRAIFADAMAMLQIVLGTKQDILLLGASGTGGMEAALANVVTPGDALLVVVCGQFGERFVQIAEIMGANVDRIDADWGAAPDLSAIAARIKARSYRAVVCVHNESSTGVVTDVAAIGALLRDTPTLLVVDSVSGVGGIDMRMDEWGIDVLVAASQKALMCPPGLAFVVVSEKATQIIDAARGVPRFYFDLRRAKASLQ